MVDAASGVGFTIPNFARPANTTAYNAGSVIGTSTTTTAGFLVKSSLPQYMGGELFITSSYLEIDITAVPSGMTSFNLALYNVPPPSAYTDGTAWDLTAQDRNAYLGTIGLGTPVDIGSTLVVSTDVIQRQITIPAPGPLYAYLVTVGGYTPASASVFRVSFHGLKV